jgi:bisphosphoglycerate-dependent phosphoglycerate mutase
MLVDEWAVYGELQGLNKDEIVAYNEDQVHKWPNESSREMIKRTNIKPVIVALPAFYKS